MSAPPLIHYKVEATNSGKSFAFTVLKCTNLPDADGALNKTDAYVKVKVANQEEKKTPAINGTLNPVYKKDNTFVFQGGVGTVVELVAMDWDTTSADDILIQASITLTAEKLSGALQSTRLMVVDFKGGIKMTNATIGDNVIIGKNARGTITNSTIGHNCVIGNNATGRLTMTDSNIGDKTVAGDNAQGHAVSGQLTMNDSKIGDNTVAGDNARGHGAGGQSAAQTSARGHIAIDHCGRLTMISSQIGSNTVAGDNAQGHGASGQLTMADSTIGSNTVAGDNARGHVNAQNAPIKVGEWAVDACGRLTMSNSTIGDGTVAGDNAQGHGASGQLTMSGSTIGSNTVAGDNARGHAGGAVAEISIKREPRDVSKCLTMTNSKIGDNTVAGDNARGHANAGADADSETVDVIEVTRISRAAKDACGQFKMGGSSVGAQSVAGDGAIGSGVGANGVAVINSKVGFGSTIGNNSRGHSIGNVSGDCQTQ